MNWFLWVLVGWMLGPFIVVFALVFVGAFLRRLRQRHREYRAVRAFRSQVEGAPLTLWEELELYEQARMDELADDPAWVAHGIERLRREGEHGLPG